MPPVETQRCWRKSPGSRSATGRLQDARAIAEGRKGTQVRLNPLLAERSASGDRNPKIAP